LSTRRDFLKRAAFAAAGTSMFDVLRPRSGFAELLRPPQEKKLGFALVGLGSLSTNQLAPALQKTAHCRLAGIVTGTPAKAESWQARYGIPEQSIYNYDTMHRMADNDDIDVVYVVTPNALHAEHTIKAAQAGKHVLCEKPMEVSAEKCEAMIAACRKAGRQLAIGYRCQFEPHHLECVRLAREKVLGDVRIIEAGFGFPIGNPNQWRLDRDLAGGGPLMDVGIYALQTTRMLTGQEPVSVTAMETRTDAVKFREVEESMTWQMKFPSGALAYCSTTYKVAGLNRFSAFAERGSFGMAPAYNYGGNRAWRSGNQELRFEPIDQFAAEMDDFAQCIVAGRPTKVPGEEGLRDVRILMAIYEAARTGRSVSIT
jgi:predicted dehydrogenase